MVIFGDIRVSPKEGSSHLEKEYQTMKGQKKRSLKARGSFGCMETCKHGRLMGLDRAAQRETGFQSPGACNLEREEGVFSKCTGNGWRALEPRSDVRKVWHKIQGVPKNSVSR